MISQQHLIGFVAGVDPVGVYADVFAKQALGEHFVVDFNREGEAMYADVWIGSDDVIETCAAREKFDDVARCLILASVDML